jgi:hypothetical protein
MKIPKKKTMTYTIALLLILTIAIPIISLPVASAIVRVYIYIGISQNPIGVGQTLGITTWFNILPPGAAGLGGDRFKGITIEVTKPDGSKQSLGPYYTDPVGTKWLSYVPEQVGTYYFQAIYPGQVWTRYHPETGVIGSSTPYAGDTILPANSSTVEVVIQQEPVESYPDYLLPKEYWTRPLFADIKGWSQYASNWLSGSQFGESEVGDFQPYGVAPETAHILWTKPLSFGGIAGDQFGDIPYGTDDYENPWSGGIIIQGRLYYNKPMYPMYGFYCVDLQTGQEIFYQNNSYVNQKYLTYRADGAQQYPVPSFGQIYHYHSINGEGMLAYLWSTVGSNWIMYDALTGNWLLTLTGVPSGTTVTGDDGSILRYAYNSNGWLSLWNTSVAIPPLTGGTGTGSQQWKPRSGAEINATYDAYTQTSGYSWNVTAPAGLPGNILKVRSDLIIGGTAPTGLVSGPQTWETYTLWCLTTKEGQRGQQLWKKEYTKPPGNTSIRLFAVDYDSKVFVTYVKETMQMYGYDLGTGDLLWGPTEPEGDWNMYTITSGSMGYPITAYGKLYWGGYDGELRAYDLKTGEIVWKYYAGNIGGESPYGQYPLRFGVVADGKVYVYSTEHSPTKPLWRGSMIRCIDAETGDEMWKIPSFVRDIAIADGVLVTAERYSGQILAFGKGPSAVTVSASPKTLVHGSRVLVEGMVIDTAAGTKQVEQIARFPNGVPVVSDDSMSAWMEYVYMQKPRPMNATGVEVNLSILDANSNFREIGTATTDSNGFYTFNWIPDIEGPYTLYASFDGSESYWPSHAETAFVVDEAIPTPTQQPLAALPPTEMYVLGIGVAIIIAIAIATLLIIKKRP